MLRVQARPASATSCELGKGTLAAAQESSAAQLGLLAAEASGWAASPSAVGPAAAAWAAAWALDEAQQPLFAVVPGGDRQRELAYRFGINLIMYTLTGNYKSDQVHLPSIMRRLGL